MTTYNFPEHVQGDTFLGKKFQVLNQLGAIDLTNASIVFSTLRDNHILSSDDGDIVITAAASGCFEMIEQIIDWEPATYDYELKITLAFGRTRTYLKGTWPIVAWKQS